MPLNFIKELAGQWKFGQMISFIKWDGADRDDNNGYGDVFLEVGYPTSYGACSFITPYFKRMPPDTDQVMDRLVGMRHISTCDSDNNI